MLSSELLHRLDVNDIASDMVVAVTMCLPALNADVIQKVSPRRSNTFRICSRPAAFAR